MISPQRLPQSIKKIGIAILLILSRNDNNCISLANGDDIDDMQRSRRNEHNDGGEVNFDEDNGWGDFSRYKGRQLYKVNLSSYSDDIYYGRHDESRIGKVPRGSSDRRLHDSGQRKHHMMISPQRLSESIKRIGIAMLLILSRSENTCISSASGDDNVDMQRSRRNGHNNGGGANFDEDNGWVDVSRYKGRQLYKVNLSSYSDDRHYGRHDESRIGKVPRGSSDRRLHDSGQRHRHGHQHQRRPSPSSSSSSSSSSSKSKKSKK
eukprot:CAMPEP_0172519896 /NCGR_PEP_ID=MMETSP1066-20121228/291687_1 /TAXON_ID=671091 /ORGANISM="Coscinodiscus wailesii, Strain CCMP2513" /LENGTH=263 /DNA_ID=CAMNT_0013302563 /DNA_START=73 /DNA_END=861 /DNA_ORIENTATION=+